MKYFYLAIDSRRSADRARQRAKVVAAVKIYWNVEAVNSTAMSAGRIGAHENDGIVKCTRDFFFRGIYFTIPRRPLIGTLDASRRQRRCARRCQGKLTYVFVAGNKKDTRENREKSARSTDRNRSPNISFVRHPRLR